MKLYVNGLGCISPQPTYADNYFFEHIEEYSQNRMYCQEPSYEPYFEAKSLRRMGRILKFGVAAAKIAISQSRVKEFDLISTGTGLGCLQDSELFLKNVIEGNEGVVSPTPFIQSTHNTVSGLIALQLGCKSPNLTFSHKGSSFESALLEAKLMMLDSDKMNNVLVGSYDEITPYSYAVMNRLNILKSEPCSNLNPMNDKGLMIGEGANFFVLSKEKNDTTLASFTDIHTTNFVKDANVMSEEVIAFLKRNNLFVSDIDIVLNGASGDAERDKNLKTLNNNIFNNNFNFSFKRLCGEYMTASAFAMYFGAKLLNENKTPSHQVFMNVKENIKNVLICNQYKENFNLILLSK
jgi:3-oxoacyl-(acyl-carrier-protein) synthase